MERLTRFFELTGKPAGVFPAKCGGRQLKNDVIAQTTMQNTSDILKGIKNNPDPDAKVMWHLVQNGSDLTKPHEPDFAFSTNSEIEAKSIADILSKMGFNVSIYTPDAKQPNYEVVGVAIMILELNVLIQLSIKFEEIAKQFNGEYLGWGAEVVN